MASPPIYVLVYDSKHERILSAHRTREGAEAAMSSVLRQYDLGPEIHAHLDAGRVYEARDLWEGEGSEALDIQELEVWP